MSGRRDIYGRREPDRDETWTIPEPAPDDHPVAPWLRPLLPRHPWAIVAILLAAAGGAHWWLVRRQRADAAAAAAEEALARRAPQEWLDACDALPPADPWMIDPLHDLLPERLPSAWNPSRNPEAGRRYAEAAAALRRGDWETARLGFRDAAMLLPGAGDLELGLALALVHQHNADAAALLMEAAAVRHPAHAGVWTDVAAVRGAMGRIREASAAVEEALRLEPDLGAALHNRAVLDGRAGRWTEAADGWDLLAAEGREAAPPAAGRLHVQALMRLERWADAAVRLEACAPREPPARAAAWRRAAALIGEGRTADGVRAYAESVIGPADAAQAARAGR